MIERTASLKTVEGDELKFPLPEGQQFWEIRLSYSSIDRCSGYAYQGKPADTVLHVRRATLERAGLLPLEDTKEEGPATETPEQLMIRLLERLGVRFGDQ
jgi:hypothetical protein